MRLIVFDKRSSLIDEALTGCDYQCSRRLLVAGLLKLNEILSETLVDLIKIVPNRSVWILFQIDI